MAALLLLATGAWGQARTDVPANSALADRLLPLEITVNGDKVGTWPLVERQGVLYASAEALEEWRLRAPSGSDAITVRGVQYWALTRIPGFQAKPNYANQSIELEFAPEAFTATRVSQGVSERLAITPVLPSVFTNYELNYSTSRSRGTPAVRDLGALLELGGSTNLGLLTTSVVGRNLLGTSPEERGFTRLETTFSHSFPQRNLTLRVGDTSTRTGQWGRTVYYGGIQLGTNYSLTPGFITQPVPIVRGVSVAPSTVELYVNGTLRQVSEVPAGPFAINNAAVLTGTGEARVVVRDILGREVVISQPFFTSSSLLAAGLSDWGVDAGALRLDLGQDSFRYGKGFAAATWRHGFSEQLTGEVRGEISPGLRAAGLGVVRGFDNGLLLHGALAASNSDAGAGLQWSLGVEQHWLQTSLYAQAESSSDRFRSLGLGSTLLANRRQWAAGVTHNTATWGSFSLALAEVRSLGAATSRTASLSYSTRLPHDVTLNATVSAALGVNDGVSVSVNASMPLDSHRNVSATANQRGQSSDLYASAYQSAGLDAPLGWRVLGGMVDNETHAEGGLYYEGKYGNLYSDLSVSPRTTALRAGASGGLVFAEGGIFATRRLEQSYAVVEVKDFEGVGVGIGSTKVTTTDKRGYALVPNLSPYVANQVRLDPQDLPISAEIDSIENIVVPPLRSAVKISFPVRSGRAALLRIVFDDGQPAPPGAVIRFPGEKAEYWVARKGEAYVTGLKNDNVLTLTWNDQVCDLEVHLPPFERDNIARVPAIACKGVKR